MAWDYVYIIFFLFYVLLTLAFVFKDRNISSMVGMGMMVAGVFLWINGAQNVNNFYTQTFAVINIAIGGYISIRNGMEMIEENI